MVELSVIIVSYNTADALRACLDSLTHSISALCISAEIIIVDNASTDGSLAAARQAAPDARLITNSANVGYARAANQGARAATGWALLFLNPDTIVNTVAIRECFRALKDQRVAAVAPVLLNTDGSLQRSWHSFPTLKRAILDVFLPVGAFGIIRRALMTAPPSDPEWIIGAFLMIRRDAFDTVGPFSERTFMYSEDMDWCHRARLAGFSIRLLRSCSITHHGGAAARRHYSGLERDIAAEAATDLWMGRSRVWELCRLATQELVLGTMISLLLPSGATKYRRALDRRRAARTYYWRVLNARVARKRRCLTTRSSSV